MRRKYLNSAALLCVLAYVLSLIFTAYRVSTSLSERKTAAGLEFLDLVDRASSSAVLGYLNEPFKDEIKDIVKNSKTLAAVSLTGPSGVEYAFERAAGYLVVDRDGPHFASRFDVSSTVFFAPLRYEGVRNATLSASYILFDRETFFPILRDAFTLIATILAFSVLMLCIDMISSKAQTEIKAVPPANNEKNEGLGENLEAEPYDIPELAPDLHEEIVKDSPTGLYSPRSGLSWEDYTLDRLASELHRCASFEQDLSFLVMQLIGSEELIEKLYADFAAASVSFFTFKDLAFEREPNGVSIILPNIDLEHCIRMAEDFRLKLLQKLTETSSVDIKIGISSRAGRLVEVDRLVFEASGALAKAFEAESTPVIAFKSDPERYRSFISART
ncbi:hypothetical protein MASR2M78_01520 [Treponema sp.]